MTTSTYSAWRRRAGIAVNVVFIACLALFVYVHGLRILEDRVFTTLPFAANYALLLGLALIRRRPTQTAFRPGDWVLASTAWMPLALLPTDTTRSFALIGSGIGIIGVALTLVSLVSLGRNFGIVAAHRGLSTHGAYRVVRHPLYAAESVAISGYVIANPSILNFAIVAVCFFCIPLRIVVEERVLTGSAAYAVYRKTIRWRLLPGVY